MNVNEWVCVPREPTEHMKNCGRTENSERGHLLAEAAYRAMLAAAPSPAPVPVDPAEIEALRSALVAYRAAQRRMRDKWADGDKNVKRDLWRALHDCESAADAALAANGEKS